MEKINIRELHSHPRNPRTQLGDLSELAESIKINGLMQNLTVIPGHYEGDSFMPGEYTILIGHRRTAAAKMAGVTELPCIVVENLTEAEQICIMLTENMQREDLTPYEEAKSFEQLTLFGMSEKEIAQKSGFSRTTVRNRLKMAELDDKVFEKKVGEFQLNVSDIIELGKIKSLDKRNELLGKATSSDNLKWLVKNALEKAEIRKVVGELIKNLESAGFCLRDENSQTYYTYKKGFFCYMLVEAKKFLDEDVTQYFEEGAVYSVNDTMTSINIYVPAKMEEQKKETEEEKQNRLLQKKREEINNRFKKMAEARKSFVKDILERNVNKVEEKGENLWKLLMSIEGGVTITPGFLGSIYLGKSSWYGLPQEEKNECIQWFTEKPFGQQLLMCAENRLHNIPYYQYRDVINSASISAIKELTLILEDLGFSYEDLEDYNLLAGTDIVTE